MKENPLPKMSRGLILFRKWVGILHPSLLALGVLLWGASKVYFPILSPGIKEDISWLMGVLTTSLCFFSLIWHNLSHKTLSWILGQRGENAGFLGFLGDIAQKRKPLPSPLKEFLVSLAGPLSNGALALFSYFFWNFQFVGIGNAVALFLMVFNLLIGTINLSPFLPFDGGRMVWALLPPIKERSLVLGGKVASIFLSIWGLLLIFQGVQYGRECGFFTIFVSLLILWGSLGEASPWAFKVRQNRLPPWKITFSLSLIPLMVLSFLSFLPLPWGIEAPGQAVEVEGMVKIPQEFFHLSEGRFLLTLVFSQTPVLFSQFFYSLLDPAVDLVPPERVIPPEIPLAEWTEINFQELEESQANAIFVALNSAGYPTFLEGKGALVVSFLEESPAKGILKEGDLIVKAEGKKVMDPEDLSEVIGSLSYTATVKLIVERDGATLNLEVPLISPKSSEEKPRLGIRITTRGFKLKTPFPVEISCQKILGGPSAGLMFALSIYNLITPDDLTGGRIIAGTGTMDRKGNVGPVGGVKEKVISAERASAEYFLCPEKNFEEALKFASKIKVVKVRTFWEAIAFLEGLK